MHYYALLLLFMHNYIKRKTGVFFRAVLLWFFMHLFASFLHIHFLAKICENFAFSCIFERGALVCLCNFARWSLLFVIYRKTHRNRAKIALNVFRCTNIPTPSPCGVRPRQRYPLSNFFLKFFLFFFIFCTFVS